jgi:hypothetical protein
MRASWYTALADPRDDDDHAPSGRVDHGQDLPDTNAVAAALDTAVRAQLIGREAVFERVVWEPGAVDLAIENVWARLGQRCVIRDVVPALEGLPPELALPVAWVQFLTADGQPDGDPTLVLWPELCLLGTAEPTA